MSGSPKHTNAQLQERERAEEQRRREEEAEREAARRRAEAEREAQRRLLSARAETQQAVQALGAELAPLCAEPLCLYVPADAVQELKRTAQEGIGSAVTETDYRTIGRNLKQVRARVCRLIEQAGQLHEQHQRLSAELARFQNRLDAIDPERKSFFPADVLSDLQASIHALTTRLPTIRTPGTPESLREAENVATTLAGRIDHALEHASIRQTQQQEAAAALDALGRSRKRFTDEPRRGHWVQRELAGVDQRLVNLQQRMRDELFVETLALARALTEELQRLDEVAEQCEVTSRAAAKLRDEVTEVQPNKIKVFDERGASELMRLLASAHSTLKNPDRLAGVAAARKALAKVQELLVAHRTKVAEEFAVWQVEHNQADADLTRAAVRFAGLQTDAVVLRWKRAEVNALAVRLERARAALEAGRFAEVDASVKNIPDEIERLVADAQPLELQARLQIRMVEGVCRVMNNMGYHVHGPKPESVDDPRATLIVQAGRDSGERIAVAVEHEGRIEYDVGGTLKRAEREVQTGGLRHAAKTCDEAEQQLNTLHALLLELGIETDGLHWDGQVPPDDTTTVKTPMPWIRPIEGQRHV